MAPDTSDVLEAVQSTVSDSQVTTVDRAFDVLSNQRRRYAIHSLQQHDKPMELADVADDIAVYENEAESTDIPNEEVKRIYTSLYHSHIPKLVNAGIAEIDQDRNTIALAENADQLDLPLDSPTH